MPSDALDSVQVKLNGTKLERARPYDNCWLACELWRQLRLDEFWTQKLPQGGEPAGAGHLLRAVKWRAPGIGVGRARGRTYRRMREVGEPLGSEEFVRKLEARAEGVWIFRPDAL